MFNVTMRESFENLDEHWHNVMSHKKEAMVIVGNGTDDQANRKVSYEVSFKILENFL